MAASVREFLEHDPLATADAEFKRMRGLERFGSYLPPGTAAQWFRALSLFSSPNHLGYWNPQIVDAALAILESDPSRSAKALSEWKKRIGTGFDYLLHPAPTDEYEDGYSTTSATDLVRLANQFHPEYLRRCEHIFTNLIVLYWAVIKRGDVRGGLEITSATAILRNKGLDILLNGYDDRVRNAIAHGEVVFKGQGIQYGSDTARYELSTYDFLERFDELWRTANALAIAVVLYLARLQSKPEAALLATSDLPIGVIHLLAAAEVEREGLTIHGIVESNLSPEDRQLHIAIRTAFRGRAPALADCARISYWLLKSGATGYARFLFEIDHGLAPTSMAVILPNRIRELTIRETPFNRITEIFDDTQLLWHDEPMLWMRLRALRISFRANAKVAWLKFWGDQQKQGRSPTRGKYRIRKIENASADGLARVKALVVLTNYRDADNKTIVREIAFKIVKDLSRQWFQTNPTGFGKRWNSLSRPRYIWLYIYKNDGPIRWLESGGWMGGNLIAVAEKLTRRTDKPIYNKNPEEEWRGIRLRYSIDKSDVFRVASDIIALSSELNVKGKSNP